MVDPHSAELREILARSEVGDVEALQFASALAYLAYRLTRAGTEAIEVQQSARWLHRPHPAQPRGAGDARSFASRLLTWATAAALFTETDGKVSFASADLRVYVAARWCAARPLEARLRRTGDGRFRNVWRLLASRAPELVEHVLELARSSPSRRARYRACDVLALLGEARAVEVLIGLLRDEADVVRCHAAVALGQLGDPRACPHLIAALVNHRLKSTVGANLWYAAMTGLVGIGSAAVAPLAVALHHPMPSVRIAVVACLRRLGDRRALGHVTLIPLLLSRIDDEDRMVRRVVAGALQHVHPPPALLVAHLVEPSPEARRRSAHALIHLRLPETETTLLEMRTDPDAQVRARVSVALARLGRREVRPLLAALEDPDGEVRSAAARELGETGDHSVVGRLLHHLEEDTPEVQEAVAWALGQLGDLRALAGLHAALLCGGRVARSTASALIKLRDERSVEPLLGALAHPDWFVHHMALEVIGKLRSPRSVDPLIASLTHRWRQTRAAVAEALGAVGDRRAVEPLLSALEREDDLASAVITALGEIGDPSVLPRLEALAEGRWVWYAERAIQRIRSSSSV